VATFRRRRGGAMFANTGNQRVWTCTEWCRRTFDSTTFMF